MERRAVVGPRLVRVTLGGPELAGFEITEPAASVRVLLPGPDGAFVMPAWNGNEFLLPDGTRPRIRTFTPLESDAPHGLDVAVVLHGSGPASEWAQTCDVGDTVAVSGPGRGYSVDPEPGAYLIAGDETAIPAITQLLGALPPAATVDVHIEVVTADGRIPLPAHPGATVQWHDLAPEAAPGNELVAAIEAAQIDPDPRIWAAGEAAAMQRIRRHLFEARGFLRTRTTVRGYWKVGRGGDDGDDE